MSDVQFQTLKTISSRETFAAAALTGLINEGFWAAKEVDGALIPTDDYTELVSRAWAIADAMVKAGKQDFFGN